MDSLEGYHIDVKRRWPLKYVKWENMMNKKIIVTGGLGFIGSALVRRLILTGHQVLNLDAETYAANLRNVEGVSENANYVWERADLTNFDAVCNIVESFKPDWVFHLAAESHVDNSIKGPTQFIQSNVLGTFNLLEAIRFNVEKLPSDFRIVHVSTDEVYGSLGLNEDALFSENTAYDPKSPYSASKAASDHLVKAWHHTYGLPAIITNCSNNYGPYQNAEKLIPTIIRNALAGNSIPIYGDGSNVRDWLHVDDHIDALLLVMNSGKIGSSYCIGGNNESSNLALARKVCHVIDSIIPSLNAISLIKFVKDRVGHDLRYGIDSTRLQNELGWKQRINLDDGLYSTVKWYCENRDVFQV